MIKPDAFGKRHSGAIIDKDPENGFRVVALKLTVFRKRRPVNSMPLHKARLFTANWSIL